MNGSTLDLHATSASYTAPAVSMLVMRISFKSIKDILRTFESSKQLSKSTNVLQEHITIF